MQEIPKYAGLYGAGAFGVHFLAAVFDFFGRSNLSEWTVPQFFSEIFWGAAVVSLWYALMFAAALKHPLPGIKPRLHAEQKSASALLGILHGLSGFLLGLFLTPESVVLSFLLGIGIIVVPSLLFGSLIGVEKS